jgi:hypothetical protein
VADFDAAPTNRLIQLSAAASGSMRFYRLRTPWRLNPQAALRINWIQVRPGQEVAFEFAVPASQSRTVEFAAQFPTGAWTTLTNYPAAATNRVIEMTVPASSSSGFYRLRSP